MKRTKSIYLTLLAVLLSPMAANATPITIGGLSSNDDGSTQVITDSTNDLEWLRWDVIANMSYADAAAYAAGNGWMIASSAEASLFVDALFGGADCDPLIDPSFRIEECGTADNFVNLVANIAYTDGFFGPYGAFLTPREPIQVGWLGGQLDGRVRSNAGWGTIAEWDGDANFTDFNSWMLYRATQTVPEPSTLALLGLGLVGIAARRRRKTASI